MHRRKRRAYRLQRVWRRARSPANGHAASAADSDPAADTDIDADARARNADSDRHLDHRTAHADNSAPDGNADDPPPYGDAARRSRGGNPNDRSRYHCGRSRFGRRDNVRVHGICGGLGRAGRSDG
jgi:hypothetical protein